MARIRSVKPEFWDDEELADLPRDARLLYIGLWNQADEHGLLRGNPKWIKGQIFPYDDDLDVDEVDELLGMLAVAGKVVRYRVGGKPYMFLPNLSKHQRLESAKVASKLPGPDESDPEPAKIRAIGDDSHGSARINPDESAPRADSRRLAQINPGESAPMGADKSALLYGTGSMEHVDVHRAEPADVHADPPEPKPGSDDDKWWREFWELVPRKEGKDEARIAWANAVTGKGKHKGRKVEPHVIIDGMRSYAERVKREGTERRHIKMAQGWINGRRWEDEQQHLAEEPAVDIWA